MAHYGDNVGRDKIGTQNNYFGGVPNTNNTTNNENGEPKAPETPSGLLGLLLIWLPKKFRPFLFPFFLSLFVILFLSFAYIYFFTDWLKKDSTSEKVYLSGIVHVNNAVPKQNEIKHLTLRDINANPATIDANGAFIFSNVEIPSSKRVLVDITFNDNATIPTQSILVWDVDKDTKTARIPDLYVERPKPAKKGVPAQNWKVQVIQNGNGNSSNINIIK